MECMPSMADCGKLIIGIDSSDPNTPPLLIVNVPPCMSAGVNFPGYHKFNSKTKESQSGQLMVTILF